MVLLGDRRAGTGRMGRMEGGGALRPGPAVDTEPAWPGTRQLRGISVQARH